MAGFEILCPQVPTRLPGCLDDGGLVSAEPERDKLVKRQRCAVTLERLAELIEIVAFIFAHAPTLRWAQAGK